LKTDLSFFTPVQEDIAAVEAIIRKQAEEHHSDLRSALDLILSAGGKRIRPSMTLLLGRMLNADREKLLTLSAAIELLHTATLVHDDLIDGSLLRRGMPTLNSQWGPGATVLTGDFLFACAARLAADTESVPVIKLFSQTLKTIVNGEITQLFDSRCVSNRENYYRRIYAKTASLFETAAWASAMLGSDFNRYGDQARTFGYSVGMAFQIIDDILDFTGDQVALGKPIGSDLRQGLVTLPALYYLETHPEDPTASAVLAGKCPADESELDRLVSSIRASSAIQAAHAEGVRFVEAALGALQKLPSGEQRASLETMAHYIVDRQL